MSRARQSSEFEIEVGGEPYVWRLQRMPHWTKDASSRHGPAVAVRHAEGQREAVVEFPPGEQPRYGAPKFQVSQIAPELVATAIASAIEAGWDPHSRGRTVNIVVDADGR